MPGDEIGILYVYNSNGQLIQKSETSCRYVEVLDLSSYNQGFILWNLFLAKTLRIGYGQLKSLRCKFLTIEVFSYILARNVAKEKELDASRAFFSPN